MLTKQYLYGVILAITTCLSLPYLSFSQTVLPPDQPEQDACNALPLCGGKFFTPYSYQGQGLVNDLIQTPCGDGEDNSMAEIHRRQRGPGRIPDHSTGYVG